MRLLLAAILALLLLGNCAPAPQSNIRSDRSLGTETPLFVQPERVAEKRARLDQGAVDLVFIGDSITQNYEKASATANENYRPIWEEYFLRRNALNLGYGMDATGAVLWRIEHGELDGIAPKVAVVLIGTNDTNLGRGPDRTIAGIEGVITAIRIRLPQTKILLLGILPSGKSAQKSHDDMEVNNGLAARYAQGSFVTFLDIGRVFMKDGSLDASLFVERPPQGALHPNARGQAAMARAIEPDLARLMGDRARTGP